MAGGCIRLLRSAVICWNYPYRSRVLAEEPKGERRQAVVRESQNDSLVQGPPEFERGYGFSEGLEDSVVLALPRILAVDVP